MKNNIKSAALPAYITLYEQLKQDIVSGIYPMGSRLPSKRTIAAETGVSVITVEHALTLLCDEGYTESRERSGVFVIYRDSDFQSANVRNIPPRQTMPTVANVEASFPITVFMRTMRRVMSDYGDRLLVKSPNSGCEELRVQICAYLARSRRISVSPRQVVIGSGAEYLYGLIAQLIGKDRPMAIEDPSYDKIKKVYEASGIICDSLKMEADGIASAELKSTKASALHVTPFNSFPSGITASASKKREYLRWAHKRGAVIIEDNYDSELTVSRKAEEPLFSMTEDSNVIYLNTFSKTIAPSVRVGYMLLPEHLIDEFEKKLGFYSCTVPVFEQYVLSELLRTGDFERHINRVRRRRRKQLEAAEE